MGECGGCVFQEEAIGEPSGYGNAIGGYRRVSVAQNSARRGVDRKAFPLHACLRFADNLAHIFVFFLRFEL